MSLRLIRVTVPADTEIDDLVDLGRLLVVWEGERDRPLKVIDITLPAEKTEAVMDAIEDRFGELEGFRMVLLQVEAIVPRPAADREEEEDHDEEGEDGEEDGEEKPKEKERISREELYADVSHGLRISMVFLVMVALSATVAAVGLLRDDLAVVIGAMVIAPLLRPNIALALAFALADVKLAWRALLTSAAGLGLAIAISALMGVLVTVDPEVPALASRTMMGLDVLALALAAGAAGALAFTQGLAGAVIGVMVAVALMPPTVAFGLLLGAGHPQLALQALWLTVGNTICINLAAIATFFLQGIRPRSWWQAERARKASLAAAAIWVLLLAGLIAVFFFSGVPFE